MELRSDTTKRGGERGRGRKGEELGYRQTPTTAGPSRPVADKRKKAASRVSGLGPHVLLCPCKQLCSVPIVALQLPAPFSFLCFCLRGAPGQAFPCLVCTRRRMMCCRLQVAIRTDSQISPQLTGPQHAEPGPWATHGASQQGDAVFFFLLQAPRKATPLKVTQKSKTVKSDLQEHRTEPCQAEVSPTKHVHEMGKVLFLFFVTCALVGISCRWSRSFR